MIDYFKSATDIDKVPGYGMRSPEQLAWAGAEAAFERAIESHFRDRSPLAGDVPRGRRTARRSDGGNPPTAGTDRTPDSRRCSDGWAYEIAEQVTARRVRLRPAVSRTQPAAWKVT